jgi:glycosyltransferase involved in cell wall biosynthesis
MERKPTVAVIFHHIGPYHHARLNTAADRLSLTGIEWSAKASESWGAAGSPGRYEKVSLFPEATDQYPGKTELGRAFWRALEQVNPDVVAVNGWNNFGSLIAAHCCVRHGIPMLVMSESARQDEHRTWWKEMIKRQIVGLYSAALVGGKRHVDYLVELGMPRERVFTGYDVVDNAYFARRASEIRNSKFEIRNKYDLPENYFLASARFIEKKNLLRLITAYAEYLRTSEVGRNKSEVGTASAPWDLVLLGDGPLRETLKFQLSTLNLHPHVHLPGFKPYDELPVYYALANTFVHASTAEQWGLVVNEAIASGLPVIVSERCGCVPELVGDNGFTFDPLNDDELTAHLLAMASLSDHNLERLREASRRLAARFGSELFGKGLEDAARMAIENQKKFGVRDRAILLAAARFGR